MANWTPPNKRGLILGTWAGTTNSTHYCILKNKAILCLNINFLKYLFIVGNIIGY